MGGKSTLSLRENAARTREVRAPIGRELREQYDDPQPLSECLAELLRKVEQSTNEQKAEDKPERAT